MVRADREHVRPLRMSLFPKRTPNPSSSITGVIVSSELNAAAGYVTRSRTLWAAPRYPGSIRKTTRCWQRQSAPVRHKHKPIPDCYLGKVKERVVVVSPVLPLVGQKIGRNDEAPTFPFGKCVEALFQVPQPMVMSPIRHSEDQLTPYQRTAAMLEQAHK